MIAENCEGLPLMIVTVAGLLSEATQTKEFWNEVARKENSVFEEAYEKISGILDPSYEYLPQHLKPYFLYMGVFSLKYEIPTSKLFELWSSEGILESDFFVYLEELVSRSLLLTHRKNYATVFSIFTSTSSNPRVTPKTCRLHSVFWHMCIRKARDIKFFHVLNTEVDSSEEKLYGQRRLCIQNNTLFGIKDVYTSMESNSTIRSLLCTGPHHQYPVPLCFSSTLVKILDAITIRFYEFPDGAFDLVQLRYFTFTYNGMLPTSISRLRNLEYLIVGRHLSTKLSYGAPVYLPMEIWDMKQLKHLQVMGGDLPDPRGAVLPNLLVLLDVSAHSCTKSVLQGTPNLLKLGIRIELLPNESQSSFYFDHISHLCRLESLKCIVVNPEIRSQVVHPPTPGTMFPSSLKKLSLSGLGYPWEYMSIIGKLPRLQVPKLRCYAFRGPEWVIEDGEFRMLKYLLIEDTDLVYWRACGECKLQVFRNLIIRHCYKLQEVPPQIFESYKLDSVAVSDCHPSASKKLPLYDDITRHCHGVVKHLWE